MSGTLGSFFVTPKPSTPDFGVGGGRFRKVRSDSAVILHSAPQFEIARIHYDILRFEIAACDCDVSIWASNLPTVSRNSRLATFYLIKGH